MKTENGITLIVVVLTVMIMSVLAALLVKASTGEDLLKEVNKVQKDYSEKIKNTNEKTQSIEDAWEGVI